VRLFQATIDDIPRIMDCAREFTSIIPDCPLNEAHYEAEWRKFFNSGNGVIYLMEHEGEIAGGIGGIKCPDLLTGRASAIELFWYVKPEFRSGTWPVRLLREFEQWAVMRGCHEISMIHMECSMPERMKEFYTRNGYELFETMYRKRIGGKT
jgi:GNAT superfamily N-acetyltransferase